MTIGAIISKGDLHPWIYTRALHVTTLLFTAPIKNKTYFAEASFCTVNNKRKVNGVWGAFTNISVPV
jgi:hypothetical protein